MRPGNTGVARGPHTQIIAWARRPCHCRRSARVVPLPQCGGWFTPIVAVLVDACTPLLWQERTRPSQGSVANFAQGAMKGQLLLSRWGLRVVSLNFRDGQIGKDGNNI